MTIDHRCGARTSLDLEVLIHTRNAGEVRGRVSDISIGGMRIEVAAELIPYEPVTIEFSFPPGSPARHWQAMVVHIASGTVGVMFEFFRTADLEKLVELLRASDAQAHTGTGWSVAGARHPPQQAHPPIESPEARPPGVTEDGLSSRVRGSRGGE